MIPNTNISIMKIANEVGLNIYNLAGLRTSPNNNLWGFENFVGPINNLWGAPLPTTEFKMGDYRGYEHHRRACSWGKIELHEAEQAEIRITLDTFPVWSLRPDHDITYTFAVYFSTMGDFQHMAANEAIPLIMTQSTGSDAINGSIYMNKDTFTDLDYGQPAYVYVKLLSCSEERRFDERANTIDGYTCITPQGVDMGEGYIVSLVFAEPIIGHLSVQVVNPFLELKYLGNTLTGMSIRAENNTETDLAEIYELEARTLNSQGQLDGESMFWATKNIEALAGETRSYAMPLAGPVSHLNINRKLSIFKRIPKETSEWTYMYDVTYTKEEDIN